VAGNEPLFNPSVFPIFTLICTPKSISDQLSVAGILYEIRFDVYAHAPVGMHVSSHFALLIISFTGLRIVCIVIWCSLNMVSVWRRAVVRVFLCTDSMDEVENSRRKTRLDSLLNQLRIHALTCVVSLESVQNLLNRQPINDSEVVRLCQTGTNAELLNVSDTYFKSVNQLIRQFSEQASLCFLYLPSAPISNSTETSLDDATFNDFNNRYMRALDLISDALPPSLFVNGVSCVTSTNL
jgi:hypothetical protein